MPYIDIVNETDSLWSAALIVMVCLGGAMFFLGYFGCYGAKEQNALALYIVSSDILFTYGNKIINVDDLNLLNMHALSCH